MKNYYLFTICLFLFIISLSNSSAQKTEKRSPGDFSVVSVIGDIRIELYNSEDNYIEIETKDNSPDNIITELEEGELNIRLRTKTPLEADTKIRVFYKDLEKLMVQAQALITSIDTLKGNSITFDAKSGGKMELFLDVENVVAEVKQGAILVFRGKVNTQDIELRTGGTYSAYELEAVETFVKAGAGTIAKVTASKTIEANAQTKGYIGYKGNPEKTSIKTSLGGEITHIRK